MKRYLEEHILRDLEDQMVFLGGARQVGKTTLSLNLLGSNDPEHPAYHNWDEINIKQRLIKGILPAEENFIILDEIHKYDGWRNLIKGFYDRYKNKKQFLVTGSARLDFYRRGGDSLQGRYFYYRLHPLSLNEINLKSNKQDVETLLKFGGFPRPFLKNEETFYKRWQKTRLSRLINEDLIPLEKVKEISKIELLLAILPEKVSSILSINSIREDLAVAFETADKWIHILENLYYCFRISPWGYGTLNTAKKEKKLYLWDWSMITDTGARFENLVASHLLKYCHLQEDTTGDAYSLKFLRDHKKREIDFIVEKNNQPLFGVECKLHNTNISSHITYFAQRTNVPYFYQVHLAEDDYEMIDVRTRVLSFWKLCQLLKL